MAQAAPLPVSALLRRARNAKSPKDRHDTAYYAWEASVILAVAARPPADLTPLAKPSVGAWVAALASGEERHAEAPLLAAFGLLSEAGTGRRAAPKSVSRRELLAALPAYRNAVLGHGSVRTGEFYEAAGATLVEGLEAAWEQGLFLRRDERLTYVEAIEIDASGRRRARLLDLSGDHGVIVDPRGTPDVPDTLLPRRAYVRVESEYRALNPFVLVRESEALERVYLFGSLTHRAKYLDYVSGETLSGADLEAAFPGVEAEAFARFERRRDEAPAARAEEADRFGDYKILGKLGEGGMGVVYLARQESLGRLVALKMLPPGMADDPVAVARFDREVAALSRCEHPNVIKILASGAARGTRYYAMEYVEGADLGRVLPALKESRDLTTAVSSAWERLREERKELFQGLPEAPRHEVPPTKGGRGEVEQLAVAFRDAARGLEHLHEAGIVHRDVKPQNLMLTASDRRVVVMDLGLAAVTGASRSITKDKGQILGTLRYMAPEQLQRNLLSVDQRADVYSLGATFYELLTGRALRDGDTEARLIEQILRETPPAARKVDSRIPTDLSTILGKATEKDPKLRYETAEEVAQDLDAFLEGRPISARPPTLKYVLGLAIRRNKALAATVAVALLLLIGGGALAMRSITGQRDRADAARLDADRTARRAAAHLLALRSSQTRRETPQRSVLLAVEAMRHADDPAREPLPQARRALREALQSFDDFPTDLPSGPVTALATARGGRAAVAYADGRVIVLDLDEASGGRASRVLAATGAAALSLCFSADGDWLVSTAEGGGCRAWPAGAADAGSKAQLLAEDAQDAAVLEGGTVVAPQQGGTIGVFRLRERQWLRAASLSWEGAAPKVWRGDASGRWCAGVSDGGRLGVFDLGAQSPDPRTPTWSLEDVLAFCFTSDGTALVAAARDGVHAWDLHASSQLPHVRWSPPGARVDAADVASVEGGVRSMTASGREVRRALWTMEGGKIRVGREVTYAVASPHVWLDARSGMFASFPTARAGDAQIVDGSTDPARSSTVSSLIPHLLRAEVRGRRAIACNARGEIHIFTPGDAGDGITLRGHEGQVSRLAVVEGRGWILSCGTDQSVRLWRLPTDEILGPRDWQAHAAGALRLWASPRGGWLLTEGTSPRFALWQVMSQGRLRRAGGWESGKEAEFRGFSDDDRWFAVASPSGVALHRLADRDAPIEVRLQGALPTQAVPGWGVLDPTGRWAITRIEAGDLEVWHVADTGASRVSRIRTAPPSRFIYCWHWFVPGEVLLLGTNEGSFLVRGASGPSPVVERLSPSDSPRSVNRVRPTELTRCVFASGLREGASWMLTYDDASGRVDFLPWDDARVDLRRGYLTSADRSWSAVQGPEGVSLLHGWPPVVFSPAGGRVGMAMRDGLFDRSLRWLAVASAQAPAVLVQPLDPTRGPGPEFLLTGMASDPTLVGGTADGQWIVVLLDGGYWAYRARASAGDPERMPLGEARPNRILGATPIGATSAQIALGDPSGRLHVDNLDAGVLLESAGQHARRNLRGDEWQQDILDRPHAATFPDYPLEEGVGLSSNESAAIRASRNVISAQAQFQFGAKADADGDRIGEYGGFLEISGAASGRMGGLLSPPLLPTGFGLLNPASELLRDGYLFRMYLPTRGSAGVPEDPKRGYIPGGPQDPDLSETTWCCYAWPLLYGVTGTRTFFVNQAGDLLSTVDPRFSGSGRGPDPASAFVNRGGIGGACAANAFAADGAWWELVE